jgi:hypothetical protein
MRCRLVVPLKQIKLLVNELGISGNGRAWTIRNLIVVTKETYKQKIRHQLVVYPDLDQQLYVRRVIVGERWKTQSRQRRRIQRSFPIREPGNPKCDVPDYQEYLIIKLGEIYVRSTGLKPTRGGTSGTMSKFERFASPFFSALGIGNFRNRVREYISYRKDQGL